MTDDMPHDELMSRLVSAQKGEEFDADRILEREQAYQDGWNEALASRTGPERGHIPSDADSELVEKGAKLLAELAADDVSADRRLALAEAAAKGRDRARRKGYDTSHGEAILVLEGAGWSPADTHPTCSPTPDDRKLFAVVLDRALVRQHHDHLRTTLANRPEDCETCLHSDLARAARRWDELFPSAVGASAGFGATPGDGVGGNLIHTSDDNPSGDA